MDQLPGSPRHSRSAFVIAAEAGIHLSAVIAAEAGIHLSAVIPAEAGIHLSVVIPAEAGIHLLPTHFLPSSQPEIENLDSRFRGNDGDKG